VIVYIFFSIDMVIKCTFTAVFAIFVSIVQYLATAKVDHNSSLATSSENFGSAGRSISSGWIACHIVSQWTWAATLLQSSNVAYTFGVSGPFWLENEASHIPVIIILSIPAFRYASGATIQVLLFAVLAVEIKRK
jgi:Na+/proline symporter